MTAFKPSFMLLLQGFLSLWGGASRYLQAASTAVQRSGEQRHFVSVHSRPLLTRAIEIRAQRGLCKRFFPASGCERYDITRRVHADTLQYINKIGVGINTVQFTGTQKALDDTHMFGTEFGPGK